MQAVTFFYFFTNMCVVVIYVLYVQFVIKE